MRRTRVGRSLARALAVATAVAAATMAGVLAQGRGQGGGGGGGGSSEETPLIIVFRDAVTDRVQSDGAAYIAGEPDIARAAFDDAGEVRLGFTQPKGKSGTPPSRCIAITLADGDNVEPEGSPPFLGEQAQCVNAFFHVSADFAGVRDVIDTADARFPVFGESGSALDNWKLSYSDSKLADYGYDDRVTVTCVESDPNGCYAWRIAKDDTDSLAALVSGDRKVPDAGIWSLPFAIGVCLRDHEAFVDDPGPDCRSLVFGAAGS